MPSTVIFQPAKRSSSNSHPILPTIYLIRQQRKQERRGHDADNKIQQTIVDVRGAVIQDHEVQVMIQKSGFVLDNGSLLSHPPPVRFDVLR